MFEARCVSCDKHTGKSEAGDGPCPICYGMGKITPFHFFAMIRGIAESSHEVAESLREGLALLSSIGGSLRILATGKGDTMPSAAQSPPADTTMRLVEPLLAPSPIPAPSPSADPNPFRNLPGMGG